jgi:choline kinase
MEKSNEIEVERLSGALTNAVYVVSPPKNLPHRLDHTDNDESHTPKPRRPPQKLLLRIYGAQVDHLIDREAELAILRRLAKKHIGPRLLGTFANGRFEQFLHARTLTAEDIRDKEMSRQIAKRMRELHEGIDLLPEEREGGPIVWKNIESWTKRCSILVQWLDSHPVNSSPFSPKPQKFICGTPWSFFQTTLIKYKTWLYAQYGRPRAVKDRLVFSHNDVSKNRQRLTCFPLPTNPPIAGPIRQHPPPHPLR